MNSMFEWNFADSTLIWAANLFLQLTLITSSALVIAAFCRRRPVLRHSVLLGGLMLVCVSPVVAIAARDLAIGLLHAEWLSSWVQVDEPHSVDGKPADFSATSQPATRDQQAASTSIATKSKEGPSVPAVPQASRQVAAPAASAKDSRPQAELAREQALVQRRAKRLMSAMEEDRDDAPVSILRSALPPLLLLWLVGSALLLGRVVIAWMRLNSAVKAAQQVSDPELQRLFAEVCKELDIGKVPELRSSADLLSPSVAGIWRPCVILPASLAGQITPHMLRQVLIHECAHVMRRDPAIALIQRIANALFWPHPLVHVLNWQLAHAREDVCDNYVLQSVEAPAYSRTLLSIADATHGARAMFGAVGLFESRGKLETRISDILEEQRDRSTRLNRNGVAVVAVSLMGTASLALGVGVTWGAESARVASTEAESKTPAEDHEPKIQLLNQVAAGAKAAHERLRNWSGRGTYIATSTWNRKDGHGPAVVRRVADIQFAIDKDKDAWFVKWDEQEPTRVLRKDGSSQIYSANLLHFHSILKGADWLDLRTSSAHESDEPSILGARYEEKPRVLVIRPRELDSIHHEIEGLIDPRNWASFVSQNVGTQHRFFWEELEWLKRLHYQGHKVDVFAFCDVIREQTPSGAVVRMKQYWRSGATFDRNDPTNLWRELTFEEQYGYAMTKREIGGSARPEVAEISYVMRDGTPVPIRFSRKVGGISSDRNETVEVALEEVQMEAKSDAQYFDEASFGLEDGDRVFDESRKQGFVIEGGTRILEVNDTQSTYRQPQLSTSLSSGSLSGAQWNAAIYEHVELTNNWARLEPERLPPAEREQAYVANWTQWENLAQKFMATHRIQSDDSAKNLFMNGLGMVVRMEYAGPYGDEAAAQMIQEGLQSRDEQIFAMVLGYSLPTSLAAEQVLRGMLEQCESRATQAQARMSLGRFLANVAEKKRMVDALPSRMANVVQEYGGWYLNRLNAFDPAAAEREAETLWRQVIDEFSDVMDVQQKEKLTVLAEKELRRLNHAIGRQAPEIVGKDFEGQPLKLSDTNGKVRVLMFWGHWCGPCRKHYEHLRALSDRHAGQPFEVLGVCSDEKRETIQAAVDNGQINWRFWWDGGEDRWRILQEWGLYGSPWIFVLDRDGVVRFAGLEGAELDDAVASLLQ